MSDGPLPEDETSEVRDKRDSVWLTSASHPMPIAWLPLPARGQVGICFSPGLRDTSRYTGARWDRDLDVDLAQLRTDHGVRVLVVLMQDAELAEIGVPDIEDRARLQGLVVERLSVPDRGVPRSMEAARIVVEVIAAATRDGGRVAIASRGGRGRAGTLAACVLVQSGMSPTEAIQVMRTLGGPQCPNDARQERFVESFSRDVDWFDDDTHHTSPDVLGAAESLLHETTKRGYEADVPGPPSESPWGPPHEPPPSGVTRVAADGPLPAFERIDGRTLPGPFVQLGGPDREDAEEDEAPDPLEQTMSGPIVATLALHELARNPRRAQRLGAVLGAAIGDAMGQPTASASPGPSFGVYRERGGRRFAPYTAQTQLSEIVLRALIWARAEERDLEATLQRIADGFVMWADEPQGGHRGPDPETLAACHALGASATAARGAAGGAGSAARSWPFGLVLADAPARAERWAVAGSRLTHGDPSARAGSAALAVGLARVTRGEDATGVLSEMVAAACRQSPATAARMAEAIDDAETGVGPERLTRLEGWAAHSAIAPACYVLRRHADDPRAAILEAAAGRSAVAAMVGALVGARCGLGELPPDWVMEIERSDELIELACRL